MIESENGEIIKYFLEFMSGKDDIVELLTKKKIDGFKKSYSSNQLLDYVIKNQNFKKFFGDNRIKTGRELPRQLSCLDGEFDIARIEPIKNRERSIKPGGGLWTSSLTLDDEFHSDWLRWAFEIELLKKKNIECYILDIQDDAIIYEINFPQDIQKLYDFARRENCSPLLELVSMAGIVNYPHLKVWACNYTHSQSHFWFQNHHTSHKGN